MAGATSVEAFLESPCSRILDDVEGISGTGTTLGDLRSSEATVYDFWTTRCTNCPQALERLDSISRQRESIKFVGVNIDDMIKAREVLKEAASAGKWTRLTHVHLDEEAKDRVKEVLGMRTVPFYVVVGKEGNVLGHGNGKTLPLKTAEALDDVLFGKEEEVRPLQPRDHDEVSTRVPASDSTEINPANANMPPPAADSDKARVSVCEGGVCRLPRRQKTESQSASGTRAPAIEPGSEPARMTNSSMDEEDIRKLQRVNIREGDSVTASPRAIVECDGNVCKLVRKTPARAAEDKGVVGAASGPVQHDNGMPKGDASLGVGDVLPVLQVVEIGEADGAPTSLERVRAGGRAVLDFWTTRCVRCPAALDGLESLAKTAAADEELRDEGSSRGGRCTFISVNLDNLQRAKTMIAEGRWPSVTHVFAGREEDAASLDKFKERAGLKSVPFYVVVDADGRIEQIGGPGAIDLSKTMTSPLPSGLPCPSTSSTVERPSESEAAASPEPVKAPFVFTIDEDF